MKYSIADVGTLAEGLDHPECIAVHPDGSVWAGGEAGQVYKISPDGKKTEEICSTGGFILGIAFSPDCSWLALCDLKHKCVWKLELESFKLEKFAVGADGEDFQIPNYPVFDSVGNLYVSESGAFRTITGKIFKFSPSGDGEIWHQGPFNFANGLALSKDEKTLFIVSTFLPGVETVSISDDGSAGERDVYATLPQTCPDGIAFDAEENLYVSCYAPNRIYKVSKQREVVLLIDDWEGHILANPTNIAFGGKDYSTLYVANLGRWHVATLPMDVPGLKLICHKK
ncbi:SMP-30/gluconolactonase/LRE family protein [Litoribacter populi]|uniref:SMP-30/gluconolactonase/LRE family protein n=1 Tax=Litoribacter populi TaxID=2598460 RepID=UPI00117DB239|nr:SMP-30/gluconolactonase/LRE family protein [Litoribacter populi]